MEFKVNFISVFAIFFSFFDFSEAFGFGGNDNVYQKYAKLKVFRTCFGDKTMLDISKRLEEAIVSCYATNSKKYSSDFSKMMKESRNLEDLNYDFPLKYTPQIFEPVHDSSHKGISFKGRKKRGISVFYPEFLVRSLKDRLISHISNVTCILQNLNYIRPNYEINPNYIIRELRSAGFDHFLTTNIAKGIQYCEKLNMCSPLVSSSTAMPVKIKKAMNFIRCVEEEKFKACMRKDLMNEQYRFELKGLDGVLDHLNTGDQMMAVVWADIQMNGGQEFNYVF